MDQVVLEYTIPYYDFAFVDDGSLKAVNDVPVIGKVADISKLFGEYKLLIETIGNNVLHFFSPVPIQPACWKDL